MDHTSAWSASLTLALLLMGDSVPPLTTGTPSIPLPHFACDGSAWTAPQTLDFGLSRPLRNPVIAAGTAHDLFVVSNTAEGSPASFDPRRDFPIGVWRIIDGSLHGTGIHALSVGAPTEAGDFMFPTAAVDRSGRLHVVWAAPSRGAQESAGQLREPHGGASAPGALMIWHASYSSEHWSTPDVLGVFQEATWNPAAISQLVATSDGGVALAFPLYFPRIGGAILHAQLRNGRWRTSVAPIRQPGAPVYVSALETATGRIIIAYIAAAGNAGVRDVNSVFSVHSLDSGSTWTAPTLVSLSGEHPATNPRLVLQGDKIGIMWAQSNTVNLTSDVIRYAHSADGGHSWSRASQLPAHSAGLLRPFLRCGHPAVVFESEDASQPHPVLASIKHGVWTDPVQLFPRRTVFSINIAEDRLRCVHMIAISADRDSLRVAGALRPVYSRSCELGT